MYPKCVGARRCKFAILGLAQAILAQVLQWCSSSGAFPSSQRTSLALPRMALAWNAIPTLLRVLVLEAWRAAPSAAQLPPTCREAAVHVFFTCTSGAPPRYFFPGWGPCSLCWGWMCAGFLLGASCIAVAWMRVSTRPSPAPAWTVAALELLNCVAEGGEAELTALAEAAGQSPAELLCPSAARGSCATRGELARSPCQHSPPSRSTAAPRKDATAATHAQARNKG